MYFDLYYRMRSSEESYPLTKSGKRDVKKLKEEGLSHDCFKPKKEKHTNARLGTIETNYGTYETPMFMPVGTRATVKNVWRVLSVILNLRVGKLTAATRRKLAAIGIIKER